MTNRFQLAQANIARMLAPLDDPLLADFVAALDAVNALAEASPGFVWRLKEGNGNATDVRIFDDEMLLFNLSVWASLDALRAFVYTGHHHAVLRQRKRWFVPPDRSPLVLWWVPESHQPTTEEAQVKFEHLWQHGPTPEAFTFQHPFDTPD
jgi:hypothetical protein